MTDKVLGVILGGGQGSRLSPLTLTRSKPAVPIAGKYRLVDIPISNCLNSGVHRMFVLTQFNSASLNKHIKNTYHFSHFSKAFVDILAAEQTPDNPSWYQGTADAVRKCMHHIVSHDFDYVLILSGDQLYQMDFQEMLKVHVDKKADISIATIPVNAHDATGFGILKTNEESYISSFIEKPKADLLPEWLSETGSKMQSQGRNYLASMGIYIFNRKVLIDMLNEKPEETDFGKEIIPRSLQNHTVLSYQYEGYWTDIGNIASFFEANLGLTDEIPEFNMFDNNHTIFSRARMLPPSKVSGTALERSIISEGCIIQASRVERSVVGIRSRIGKGSTISNCYVMGADYYETLDDINASSHTDKPLLGIGEGCYINNAIVDKNARIGNNVHINGGSHLTEGDFGFYVVRDGIVVVKKGAIVPNGTKI